MAKDYAKQRKSSPPKPVRKKAPARKKAAPAKTQHASPWRWYGAGLATGLFLSFVLYMATLPAEPGAEPAAVAGEPKASSKPKPRFDFYTLLPEQKIEVDVDPAEVTQTRSSANSEAYLLQAGSFRQRDDADRRRAELLLLGLEPKVEETNGDNGQWFRVYVGPFASRSAMSKARSLTAAQNIDTLLLKRGTP